MKCGEQDLKHIRKFIIINEDVHICTTCREYFKCYGSRVDTRYEECVCNKDSVGNMYCSVKCKKKRCKETSGIVSVDYVNQDCQF